MSTTRVIKRHAIGRRAGDDSPAAIASPTGWFIMAPVGSEIVHLELDGNMHLHAEVDQPAAGIDVELPIILVALSQPYTPLLGTTRGEFLGRPQGRLPDGKILTLHVFKQAPWPTSTLEAVRAQGNG